MRGSWMVAVVVAAGLVACEEQLVCKDGEKDCDGRCVEIALDAANCGACGVVCGAGEACKASACTDCASACGAGQTCEQGVCKAALYVACFTTDEVVGVNAALSPVGPAYDVDDGPVSLAWLGDRLWAAHGFTMATLVGFTPGTTSSKQHVLEGDYLNAVHAAGALLYVTSHAGTLLVADPVKGVLDEVALGAAGVEVNPRGVAVAGTKAVVALAGDALTPAWGEGQELVVVDVAASATCTAPPCGSVARHVSLDVPAAAGVVGAYDDEAFPFPSDVAVLGTKAYVTLANLKESGGFYGTPAGHGRLAVLDTATAAAPTFVDLGASCTNPGSVTLDGSTLWIGCGTYGDNCFPSPSSTVLPVSLAGENPVVGTPVTIPAVPSGLKVCGGVLYASDQCSGSVASVPTSGGTPISNAVCTGGPGWDFASAVACGAVAP